MSTIKLPEDWPTGFGDFLKDLSALSASYGFEVTEWMDAQAVTKTADGDLVAYIAWDDTLQRYLIVRYMDDEEIAGMSFADYQRARDHELE